MRNAMIRPGRYPVGGCSQGLIFASVRAVAGTYDRSPILTQGSKTGGRSTGVPLTSRVSSRGSASCRVGRVSRFYAHLAATWTYASVLHSAGASWLQRCTRPRSSLPKSSRSTGADTLSPHRLIIQAEARHCPTDRKGLAEQRCFSKMNISAASSSPISPSRVLQPRAAPFSQPSRWAG